MQPVEVVPQPKDFRHPPLPASEENRISVTFIPHRDRPLTSPLADAHFLGTCNLSDCIRALVPVGQDVGWGGVPRRAAPSHQDHPCGTNSIIPLAERFSCDPPQFTIGAHPWTRSSGNLRSNPRPQLDFGGITRIQGVVSPTRMEMSARVPSLGNDGDQPGSQDNRSCGSPRSLHAHVHRSRICL